MPVGGFNPSFPPTAPLVGDLKGNEQQTLSVYIQVDGLVPPFPSTFFYTLNLNTTISPSKS